MAYQLVGIIKSLGVLQSVGARIGTCFTGALTRMMEASSGNSRRRFIEKMNAKSDEELARMGIRRDDIVHRAFEDRYYT